jgi:hypothetical protein
MVWITEKSIIRNAPNIFVGVVVVVVVVANVVGVAAAAAVIIIATVPWSVAIWFAPVPRAVSFRSCKPILDPLFYFSIGYLSPVIFRQLDAILAAQIIARVYGPGEYPDEVGAERLVKVPARGGSEGDGGKLVVEGVEDIGPVDGLYNGGKG